MNDDEKYLRLVSFLHYVLGGIVGRLSCIPLIGLAEGIAMVSGAEQDEWGIRWLLIVVAPIFMVVGWSLAAAIMLAGGMLAKRKHFTYCRTIAVIECLLPPFGTLLGILTAGVLLRPGVKRLFGLQSG